MILLIQIVNLFFQNLQLFNFSENIFNLDSNRSL